MEERFDTDYPEIVIPEPVVLEYDKDWVLSEYEADGLAMGHCASVKLILRLVHEE